MDDGLASSVSDQAAGEVSLPIRFRQRHLDNSGFRGRFQPKYEEKHLFLGWSVVDHEKVRVSELAPGPGLRSLDLES